MEGRRDRPVVSPVDRRKEIDGLRRPINDQDDLVFRKRGETMKGTTALLAVLVSLFALTPLYAADPKPNILVIIGDDVGWMNVSSYGGDIMGVKTPNIDRIGNEGLRLTSFYAQPSCTAGRAAFITGQLPVRTGLTTVGTPGSPAGLAEGGHHAGRDPEDARLRDGTVRQEPPRRPRRAPAAPPWLRRVLGQPLPPQRQRGPRRPGSPNRSRVPQEIRPARHRLRHRRRPDEG